MREQLNYYSEEDKKYLLLRNITSKMIADNFWYTKNPYSPILLDLGERYILVGRESKLISVIDAKARVMTGGELTYALEILQSYWTEIIAAIWNLSQEIILLDTDKVEQLSDNILYMRELLYSYLTHYPKKSKDSISRELWIINKLFVETKDAYPQFWKASKSWEKLIPLLTEEGKHYFSLELLQPFLDYNRKTNFLGRQWKEYLFPSHIFEQFRNKLTSNEVLSELELGEFIDYLLQKEEAPWEETREERNSRHYRNKTRTHASNILYAMLYSEYEYSYIKLRELSKDIHTLRRWIDRTLEGLLEQKNKNTLYTDWGIKALPALAIKELRRQVVTDYIRSRTAVSDALLKNKNKYTNIQTIFETSLKSLQHYYLTKWYNIQFHTIEIVNYFVWNQGIDFDDRDSLSRIEKNLTSLFSATKQTKSSYKDIFSIDWNQINTDKFDKNIKNLIQHAFVQDGIRGTGQWAKGKNTLTTTWEIWIGIENIKIKTTFTLFNQSSQETIENLSYEHVIVNMNTLNEWWLYDHNIFYDPLKTLHVKLRISSALDVNILVDSIGWWIDKTIYELNQLQSYLRDDSKNTKNIPLSYIQQQFNNRKYIPQEILEIAEISEQLTYLDIQNNHILKDKIELAVAKYILQEQLRNGKLQRFIYDDKSNETTALLRMIKDKKRWWQKNIVYTREDNLLDNALQHRDEWIYCLSGGGSNNLMRAIFAARYSDKWYIWFQSHDNTTLFIKVSDLRDSIAPWVSIQDGVTIQKEWTQEEFFRHLLGS